MYSLSESDWAYLAGIIDGEGHISVVDVRDGRYTQRRLVVTNCCLPLLISLARRFGGRIHGHQPEGPKRTRASFEWYGYGAWATDILRHVLPYLIGKREEAEIFLSLEHRPRQAHDRRCVEPHVIDAGKAAARQVVELRARKWTFADIPPELGRCKPVKTHCPQGHPYAPDRKPGKDCRLCRKTREAGYEAQKRANRQRRASLATPA